MTHHVSYKEALPASETIAYQSTGLGTQVVDGWQEVLPVEANHLLDPRIQVDGPRPQTFSGAVVDVPVATAFVEPAVAFVEQPAVAFVEPAVAVVEPAFAVASPQIIIPGRR